MNTELRTGFFCKYRIVVVVFVFQIVRHVPLFRRGCARLRGEPLTCQYHDKLLVCCGVGRYGKAGGTAARRWYAAKYHGSRGGLRKRNEGLVGIGDAIKNMLPPVIPPGSSRRGIGQQTARNSW